MKLFLTLLLSLFISFSLIAQIKLANGTYGGQLVVSLNNNQTILNKKAIKLKINFSSNKTGSIFDWEDKYFEIIYSPYSKSKFLLDGEISKDSIKIKNSFFPYYNAQSDKSQSNFDIKVAILRKSSNYQIAILKTLKNHPDNLIESYLIDVGYLLKSQAYQELEAEKSKSEAELLLETFSTGKQSTGSTNTRYRSKLGSKYDKEFFSHYDTDEHILPNRLAHTPWFKRHPIIPVIITLTILILVILIPRKLLKKGSKKKITPSKDEISLKEKYSIIIEHFINNYEMEVLSEIQDEVILEIIGETYFYNFRFLRLTSTLLIELKMNSLITGTVRSGWEYYANMDQYEILLQLFPNLERFLDSNGFINYDPF